MLTPNHTYHIVNHANGQDNLFTEDENYRYFLEKYRLYIAPVADTIAYCLMPNHFHFLVRIKPEEMIARQYLLQQRKREARPGTSHPKFGTLDEIPTGASLPEKNLQLFVSKQFSNLFSSYTQSFNKVYHRRGSLFIKNFKRFEIHSGEQLRNTILYIHLNPVKHGFTTHEDLWKWSSWQRYLYSGSEQEWDATSGIHAFDTMENLIQRHQDKRTQILNMLTE